MGFFVNRKLTEAQLKEKEELKEEINKSKVLTSLNNRIELLERQVKSLNEIISNSSSILVLKNTNVWRVDGGEG